jgi:hypothetical protein
MPWFWTDEVAATLVSDGRIDPESAAGLMTYPVAYRSDRDAIEEATQELAEDGEIPLAA